MPSFGFYYYPPLDSTPLTFIYGLNSLRLPFFVIVSDIKNKLSPLTPNHRVYQINRFTQQTWAPSILWAEHYLKIGRCWRMRVLRKSYRRQVLEWDLGIGVKKLNQILNREKNEYGCREHLSTNHRSGRWHADIIFSYFFSHVLFYSILFSLASSILSCCFFFLYSSVLFLIFSCGLFLFFFF